MSTAPDLRYEIIVYWSAEDEAYIAEVPELAGCVSDGDSYGKTVANAKDAARTPLKGWTRAKKRALVDAANPDWSGLRAGAATTRPVTGPLRRVQPDELATRARSF